MKCPVCSAEYACPCKYCVDRPTTDVKPFIVWQDTGDDWQEACPECGFTASVHWWYDYQFYSQKEKPKKEPSNDT